MDRPASINRALVAGFVAALVLRIMVALMGGPAGPQEIRYLTLARGMLAGEGYTGHDHRFPDIIQPPLFPLMLAAGMLLPAPELAVARGVSILWGALTVVAVGLLTRRLFGARAARRAVFLTAGWPLLTVISGSALTESTYALLVTTSGLILMGGPGGEGVGGRRAWLAGTLLGLAYLARPEALTCAVAAGALLCFARIRGGASAGAPGALRVLAALAAGVAISVVPYLLWVHQQTGRWLLAPKAVLFQVYEKLQREGIKEGWSERPGTALFHERVRFGLNAERTAIRAHDEYAAVSVGLGGGLMLSGDESVSVEGPATLLSEVGRNLAELYLHLLKQGLVAPVPLLMLAGIGCVSTPWRGRYRTTAIVPLALVAGGASFLMAPLNPRFLYTWIVLLVPWVARGWLVAETCFARSVDGAAMNGVRDGSRPASRGERGLRRRAVRAAAGFAIGGIMMVHLVPAAREPAGRYAMHEEAGRWLRETAGAGRRVMAETPVVTYYAGAAFEVLPYAPMEDVLYFARQRGVEYLVVDSAGVERNRPQLVRWLNPWSRHPGLEVVRTFRHGRTRALHVYRLEDLPGR